MTTSDGRNCRDACRVAPVSLQGSQSGRRLSAPEGNMNISRGMTKYACCGAAVLLAMLAQARATSIVYTPVNPSFGGNPLNGPVLLNSANAQNRFKDPAAANGGYQTPLALA